eukprot:5431948-Pyramimonas_sp.AAC.1
MTKRPSEAPTVDNGPAEEPTLDYGSSKTTISAEISKAEAQVATPGGPAQGSKKHDISTELDAVRIKTSPSQLPESKKMRASSEPPDARNLDTKKPLPILEPLPSILTDTKRPKTMEGFMAFGDQQLAVHHFQDRHLFSTYMESEELKEYPDNHDQYGSRGIGQFAEDE